MLQCGCGPGQSDLRRACVVCRFLYSQVIALRFCGEGDKDLTFRRCRRGVGRGSQVGGRDWAWWSGKTLELIAFGVATQWYIVFCIWPFILDLCPPS